MTNQPESDEREMLIMYGNYDEFEGPFNDCEDAIAYLRNKYKDLVEEMLQERDDEEEEMDDDAIDEWLLEKLDNKYRVQILELTKSKERNKCMTTFWLSFTDPEATADKRFLGVAIFDMDESEGELSVVEIVKQSWALGVNPGGCVSVREVGPIPDEHKNKLITDDELLLRLGSTGRANSH